jgi:hypothetical protein
MSGPSLYQKNLLFLDTAMPALAALAREAGDTLTRPVLDADGQAVDIDLGESRFYNRPALEFAAEQVASWKRSPNRVVVNAPDPESLVDEATKTVSMKMQAEAGDTLLSIPPEDQTGLLVVIGIGLGLHIQDLIKTVAPRHVVLIEPIEEFAVHSLHALDWVSLLQDCKAQGTTLDVIANFDPRAVQTELEGLITKFGAFCMDGAYSFMHYQTDVTRAIARGFQELAGMKSILQGYYADERLMIENTVANVTGDEFWMVDGTFQAVHDIPAFVIGSGPSLDGALETIRKWQDYAVIFCAGSALQSLLAAGIRPDFQIEKENNQTTEDRVHHIFGRHGDGRKTFGINLIASSTVQPSIVGLFDDTFLFHREILSSTRLFGDGFNPVVGTGPFSANTAFAAATVLGFRNITLFGCDCGSVDKDQHHARNTVYHTRDGHASGHSDMPVPVASNYGGQAWSNPYFLWSRWVFESMISNAGIAAFNCSDGVAIAGAAPVRPDELVVPGQPLNKTRALMALKSSCQYQAPGSYLAAQNVTGVVDRWRDCAGDVRTFLDEMRDTADLNEFEDALVRFVDRCEVKHRGALSPIRGSMRSMVPVAGYFLNRAADDESRAHFLSIFHDVYDAEVTRMLADCTQMLEAIGRDHGLSDELRATG